MELSVEALRLLSIIQTNQQVYELISTILVFVFFFLFIGIFINFIQTSSDPDKSKRYRSLLTDMYVVGLTKKFAKEEDVDLYAELKEFNKMGRRRDIRLENIDTTIERNLKEKLVAESEKRLDSITDSKK